MYLTNKKETSDNFDRILVGVNKQQHDCFKRAVKDSSVMHYLVQTIWPYVH